MMQDLNEQQQAAVHCTDGSLCIIAGPGTGKTKTLTARIAHLVQAGLASPEQVLALTFTKKAAEEMRARAHIMLGKHSAAPHISTFHALCAEILGGTPEFISEPARLHIIKKIPKPAAYKGVSARELALRISRYKNLAEDDAALHKITLQYDEALADQGLMDFDDLLTRARDQLQQDPAKRAALHAQYTYVMVDEFQDTNLLQYELLKLLLGNDNIAVIGDPNQSIYGFRGASGSIFEQFITDFPRAQRITLTANYRSTPEIVRVGNAVFGDGPQLVSQAPYAGRVRAVQVLNEYSEANWVLARIQQAVGGSDFLHAVSDDEPAAASFKDFAVLYRNRAAAQTFQKVLADSGLPYQVVGDGSPYDHPQVQVLLALLRAHVSGEQLPHEGYSAAEWQTILDMIRADDAAGPQQFADRAIDTLGFERTADMRQFVNSLVQYSDAAAAVQHFDAIAGQQFYDPDADAITLLTIHASKGLEFPQVFLLAAEAENGTNVVRPGHVDPAEERRLFYVAVTRARQQLDIMHTKYRRGQAVQPSHFITEMTDAVLPKITDPNLAADQRRAHLRAAKRSQQSLF